MPSYKNNIDKFKAKGIDSVICVAVNDPYALNGWAEKLQAKDAVSHLLKSPMVLALFSDILMGYCLNVMYQQNRFIISVNDPN